MFFEEYGVFEWNVLIANIYFLFVVIFFCVFVAKLFILGKNKNIVAGLLARSITYILFGMVIAPAIGIAVGGWIHDKNIFEYAHYYTTIPSIVFTSTGLYWFYQLYAFIKPRNENA